MTIFNSIYANLRSDIVDYSDAIVLFSVRRAIVTYTGSCLRVRRDSDNVEQDFGFTSDLLDVSAIETFVGVGNNGYVVKWYNQGTGGATYDAYQVTTGNQPIIAENGVVYTKNGFPTVRILDASTVAIEDYLRLTNFYAASTANISQAIVYATETVGATSYILSGSDGDKGFLSLHTGNLARFGTVRSGGGSVANAAYAITTTRLYQRIDIANRSTIKIFLNGNQEMSALDSNTDYTMPAELRIGNTNTVARTCDFRICELMYFLSDIEVDDRKHDIYLEQREYFNIQ